MCFTTPEKEHQAADSADGRLEKSLRTKRSTHLNCRILRRSRKLVHARWTHHHVLYVEETESSTALQSTCILRQPFKESATASWREIIFPRLPAFHSFPQVARASRRFPLHATHFTQPTSRNP